MPMSWAGTPLRKNDMRRVLAGVLNAMFGTSAAASAPVVQTAPAISGLAASGATLTATPGTYAGAQTVTGQWQKNGVAISGATSLTYAVQASDGVNIAYLETATASGGATTTQRALSQYLGMIATKTFVPISLNTSNKQLMSRSPHYARDAITSLQVVLGNWYWDRVTTKTELGSGGTATYTASIEYPAGVFTQIKFGGAVTSSAVANGANISSDATAVAIPAGAKFWVRVFCTASAGIVYSGGFVSSGTGASAVNFTASDVAQGHALTYGASGLSDQTMGGTVVNSGSTAATYPAYAPLAIIAATKVPSVFLAGDSRCMGTGDTFDASGDLGELARSIGPSLPYINMGSHGDTLLSAKSNYSKRGALAAYCSHIATEYGINDLSAGGGNSTGPAVFANLQALFTVLPAGLPLFASTIMARTASSDSWATAGGQTVDGDNAERVNYNNNIRTTASPLAGFFESADATETARNSGILKTTGAANAYTADGVHLFQAGQLLIKNSGAVNPAVFVR